MITAKFDLIDFSLEMNGHANAPREGEFDLVCCAASVVSQQLIWSLENYDDLHNGLEALEQDMGPGHLYVRAKAKEWARVSVKQRILYCREGMDMLADRYPEYIRVETISGTANDE